jgi:hypothetical protein
MTSDCSQQFSRIFNHKKRRIRNKRKITRSPTFSRNLPFLAGLLSGIALDSPAVVIIGTLLGLLASCAPRVAKQWERAVSSFFNVKLQI